LKRLRTNALAFSPTQPVNLTRAGRSYGSVWVETNRSPRLIAARELTSIAIADESTGLILRSRLGRVSATTPRLVSTIKKRKHLPR
jgi:hypothetical protein